MKQDNSFIWNAVQEKLILVWFWSGWFPNNKFLHLFFLKNSGLCDIITQVWVHVNTPSPCSNGGSISSIIYRISVSNWGMSHWTNTYVNMGRKSSAPNIRTGKQRKHLSVTYTQTISASTFQLFKVLILLLSQTPKTYTLLKPLNKPSRHNSTRTHLLGLA